jgi:hypothetical protein
LELPIGLKLIDCAVFIGTNGAWAAALAKPQLDKEGRQRIGVDWKPSYSPVVEWRSCDLNDRYSAAVVAMVRAAHPEAVSGDFASRPARSTLHSATRHAAGRFHHGARAGTENFHSPDTVISTRRPTEASSSNGGRAGPAPFLPLPRASPLVLSRSISTSATCQRL